MATIVGVVTEVPVRAGGKGAVSPEVTAHRAQIDALASNERLEFLCENGKEAGRLASVWRNAQYRAEVRGLKLFISRNGTA